MEQFDTSYLNNKALKKAGVKIDFTEEQIAEYIKCSKDVFYFAKHYYKIIHVDRGLIDFVPYPYQNEILKTSVNERYVICKLPRQSGKTTAIACLFLWYALFRTNFATAILANKAEMAREILGRIQLAYENIPLWLQQGILEWNKGNITLENGSKIIARATSPSSLRGGALNIVYLDEFAFVENNMQEKFYTSAFPTITSGTTTKILITSTPNGLNLFYKLWVDSENGRNSFKRIEIHWSDTPGRDEAWKAEIVRNMGARHFEQEYDTEFLGSSATLISGAVLRRLAFLPPVSEQLHLNIYEFPIENHIYVMTVDTSRGLDQDYSAFIVFDITETPYKVVATYRNNTIPVMIFPQVIKGVAEKYNNAYVLPERNDLGEEVIDILHADLEYEYILSTTSKGRSGKTISSGFGGTSAQLGIGTNKVTKAVGCAHLKSIVESDQIILMDYNIIYELSRFAQKGKSYEAEEGHDDLAMCLVIFAWLAKQPFIKELNDVDFRQHFTQITAQHIDQDLTPVGIFTNYNDPTIRKDIIEVTPEGHKTFEQLLWGPEDDI